MKVRIKIEKVVMSYNGKSGCMCGCQGRYRIASSQNIQHINQVMGYDAYSDEDVSDRSIKIAIKKIQDAFETVKSMTEDTHFVGMDEQCAWVNDGDRTSVVYFKF